MLVRNAGLQAANSLACQSRADREPDDWDFSSIFLLGASLGVSEEGFRGL